ncbi:hypothetical protein BST61_g11282 [Cercospora zeina]
MLVVVVVKVKLNEFGGEKFGVRKRQEETRPRWCGPRSIGFLHSLAMADANTAPPVTEPIPIFKLAHRYVLYDANHVTYLRREHNISGVLMGTLPQASQQNVFLGLPLELMPEEARLLVEQNVAYIVDDTAEHKRNFLGSGLSEEERRAYQAALRKQGQAAALDASKRSDDRKKAALSKIQNTTENWNDIPEDMFTSGPSRKKKAPKARPM